MRVGIIGAGITGLSAARALANRGHVPLVFEKSNVPGGRVATLEDAGFRWDYGATILNPRRPSFRKLLLDDLSQEDLVRIQRKVFLHQGRRIVPGDSRRSNEAYCYVHGNEQLGTLMSAGLDVRYSCLVESIDRKGDRYSLLGEEVDALILTVPVPQATALLWTLGETRPIGSVSYRSCVALQLGFATALPDGPFYALLDGEQRHPLTWLSIESRKCAGRAPEGCTAMTLQLARAFSRENFEREDEWLIATGVGFVQDLFGPEFSTLQMGHVRRWKYSQPESVATPEHVNAPGGRLLLAGDYMLGGHVEDAYEMGIRVAALLP